MDFSDFLAVAPSQGGDAPGWYVPVILVAFVLVAAFLAYMYFIKKR
ncbi:hypothetical protein [Blastococcus sp. SYSU DS0617]